jgi:ATP-dependent DNA helicase RecG
MEQKTSNGLDLCNSDEFLLSRNNRLKMDTSNQNIIHLQGIGSQKVEVLEKEINVVSCQDMLYYFPYRYKDQRKSYRVDKIREINIEMSYVQLKGRILRYSRSLNYPRLSGIFDDGTGTIELVWFNSINWVPKYYKIDEEYYVYGKLRFFRGKYISIVNPQIKTECKFCEGVTRMQGIYRTTAKMKKASLDSNTISQIMRQILEYTKEPLSETLPTGIIDKCKLISLDEAIHNIHFPKSDNLLEQAQYRLKFEELFYVQLANLLNPNRRKKQLDGFCFSKVGDNFHFLKNNLPFELTHAQERVFNEIRQDMNTGKQMNRLVQGDVGSGKTVVALLSILTAIDNGFQGAIMVPTEILATQHYETISHLLEGSTVKVALLTGSTKNKVREEMLPKVKSGDIQILIGTHALIEDSVEFSNLGLVVVDEQHRFGVTQRAKLWDKNSTQPHVLVMTATPIPRTMAMTVYGDLNISTIDELPPGRKPIRTYHIYNEKRNKMYEYVREQLKIGKQVYIVYPLIEENEKIDLTNLQEGFRAVSKLFPEYSISKVHGQMKPEEKNQEMQKFVSGETQVMVSTTVIEVGIDVKNASVIIIENAERFGLSQLHQLRGRVGRGTEQAVCILITNYELSKEAQKRINVMTKTNNGFEVAEEDLKLRGPGSIIGTKQSGFAPKKLRIANVSKDVNILIRARNFVYEILNADPALKDPRCNLLKQQLHKWNTKYQTQWARIS